MPLFRAIGLGVAIIVLRVMVPQIFEALETTLLTFINLADDLGNTLGDVGTLNLAMPPSIENPR